MENTLGRDLTVGSIPKHLIYFSIPMLIGNLLQALYNTVDSIWVGRFLGPEALGAVAISFPVIMILIGLSMGLGMATTTLVAQYTGAKNYDMVKKTINSNVFLLLAIGLIMSVIGVIFNKPILGLINTPPEIMEYASSYLSVFLTGLIFMFGYNVLSAILRGIGDSKTPLIFLVYATITNIILDPILIFGVGPFPEMGVAGAALATVFSQAVSFFMGIRYLNKKEHLFTINFRYLKLDAELMKKTVRIGLPTAMQQTLVSLSFLFLNSIINSFGSTVVAAYGASTRLDNFAVLPAMSIGVAASSLTGQNLGAGKEERVKVVIRWGIIFTVSLSALIALIALFAPRILISLFTTDESVLQIGSQYLRIVGLSYIPMSIMFVSNGVLQGAGDTLPPMIFSIISLWLVRVPLANLLSYKLSYGTRGIWMAIGTSSVINMTLSLTYYARGRWKKKRVTRFRLNPNEV